MFVLLLLSCHLCWSLFELLFSSQHVSAFLFLCLFLVCLVHLHACQARAAPCRVDTCGHRSERKLCRHDGLARVPEPVPCLLGDTAGRGEQVEHVIRSAAASSKSSCALSDELGPERASALTRATASAPPPRAMASHTSETSNRVQPLHGCRPPEQSVASHGAGSVVGPHIYSVSSLLE